MKVLKQEALAKMNLWLKEFSNVLQDNCTSYAFFRGKIYSNSNGDLCVDLLAGDINGNLCLPNMEYSSEGELFYNRAGQAIKFKDEMAVKMAIYKLSTQLVSFGHPINSIYFDLCFSSTQNLKAGYVSITKSKELNLFLVESNTFENNYMYSECKSTYGKICDNWIPKEYRVDSSEE